MSMAKTCEYRKFCLAVIACTRKYVFISTHPLEGDPPLIPARHALLVQHRPMDSPDGRPWEERSMNERAHLLALLVDKEVVAILKKRLTAEERANLVLEIINPHRPLSAEQKA